jgi:DNA mismatch endonuclease (patch repair protein)
MDIWSKKKRSDVMSKIRSKNTKPELLLRSDLHKRGYRFRIHSTSFPGKPDIILPKYKTVIFVNGCFWHQHKNCIDGRIPKTRVKYWKDKLDKNVNRDIRNKKIIKKMGWKVIITWECEIEKKLPQIIKLIVNKIKQPA